MLDHILLGIDDLDRGIAFMEERTGVRAAFGGVHPGRGTQNALLRLGTRRYLEIIAPDPKQTSLVAYPELREMREPRLLTWAVHTDDIAAVAKKLTDVGIAIDGPADGSRARPDGKILHWKALRLKDDRGGLLPFFIQWSRDSVHPSVDAPSGCRLVHFAATSSDPEELRAVVARLGVELEVEQAAKSQLRARITGARGTAELSS
jgi:catechol 2,3-dioxygenase-like lactoylglutathione lyase family enzyme